MGKNKSYLSLLSGVINTKQQGKEDVIISELGPHKKVGLASDAKLYDMKTNFKVRKSKYLMEK